MRRRRSVHGRCLCGRARVRFDAAVGPRERDVYVPARGARRVCRPVRSDGDRPAPGARVQPLRRGPHGGSRAGGETSPGSSGESHRLDQQRREGPEEPQDSDRLCRRPAGRAEGCKGSRGALAGDAGQHSSLKPRTHVLSCARRVPAAAGEAEKAMKTWSQQPSRPITSTATTIASRALPGLLRLAVLAGLAVAGELASVAGAAVSPLAIPVEPPSPRPLALEVNRGQADEQVKFLARAPGYTAFLTSTEAVLTLGAGRPERAVVRLRPVAGNPDSRIVPEGEQPGVVRYVSGGPTPPVPTPAYARVRYVDVYPGIGLVYYGRPDGLEYDFVVAPGADPGAIALAVDGSERVEVDGGGTLVAHTAAGDLRQPRPVVYQDVDGVRHSIPGDYVVDV